MGSGWPSKGHGALLKNSSVLPSELRLRTQRHDFAASWQCYFERLDAIRSFAWSDSGFFNRLGCSTHRVCLGLSRILPELWADGSSTTSWKPPTFKCSGSWDPQGNSLGANTAGESFPSPAPIPMAENVAGTNASVTTLADRRIIGVSRSPKRQRQKYTNYTNHYTNAARSRPQAVTHNRVQDILHSLCLCGFLPAERVQRHSARNKPSGIPLNGVSRIRIPSPLRKRRVLRNYAEAISENIPCNITYAERLA
jgi:hypothetical protein